MTEQSLFSFSSSSSSPPSSFPTSALGPRLGSVRGQEPCSLLAATKDFNIILHHYNLTGRLSNRRPQEDHLDALKIIIIAASCLIILENLVVLLAIIWKVKSQRWIYSCLASISFSDLLAGIAYLINLCFSGSKTFQLSPNMWFLREGILFIALAASIFSLLVTAIERYNTMVKPIAESESSKTTRLRCLIVFFWILAIVIGLLPLLGWNCICDVPRCSTLLPLYTKNYILFSVIMFTVILLVVVSFYISIYSWVVKRTKQGFSNGGRSRSLRLLKTVLLILCTFLICWIPLFVLLLIDIFDRSKALKLQKVFGWIVTLAVINSFINPIIYSLISKEVREPWCNFSAAAASGQGGKVQAAVLPPANSPLSSSTGMGSSLKMRESFRSPVMQKRMSHREPLSSNSSVLSNSSTLW